MSMSTRLLSGAVLSLCCISAAFAQIHYDSGFSRRNGSLGHYYKMVNWDDSQYKEFAYWETGNANFMNWRAIFPPGYDKNNPEKYPMIVMLHGAGESGRSWAGHYTYAWNDPRYDNNGHNLLHGGYEHRQAVNRNPSHSRAFPGIVIFPQVSHSGAWSGNWNNGQLTIPEENAAKIVEYMINEYNVNEFRIYVHGLSNGAKATWDFAAKRPDLVAAGAPMSGTGNDMNANNSILVTTPWWVFQGGLDGNPSPGYTQQWINDLINRGGRPRYTLYPNTGHGTWWQAYAEPDFFSWLLAQDKREIYVFGELPEDCDGTPVQFGFSAGYLAYQWQRNGVDIAGATSRFYTATLPGIYTVRFQKRTDNQWTESFPAYLCADADFIDPTVPGNLAVTNIGFTGALADWDASTDNTAVAGYEVFLDGVSVGTTTDTEYALTGLALATAHYVQVRAFDTSDNFSALTSPVNFATNDDTEAPSVPANLLISGIADTEATATWDASTDNYELAGYEVYLDAALAGTTTETTFTFTGLTEGTNYDVSVRAFDSNGNYTAFAATDFTTTIDTEAPSVPANLAISGLGDTQATATWDASTDNYGVTGYEVYLDAALAATVTETTFAFTGLTEATEYSVTVRAFDAKGNFSALTAPAEFTTTSDTEAPSVPANLAISGIADTEATASWDASTDNYGVGGYEVYLDAVLEGTTTETTFALTGLTAGTTYNVTVLAFDNGDNFSALTAPAEFTTTIDTEAPSVPANVVVSDVSNAGATVTWDASTDNRGVTGYDVYLDDVLTATIAGTTYDFAGLAEETTYTINIVAFDAAGNYSAPSADTDFTTLITMTGASGLLYTYYESNPSWPSTMPNFPALTPVATGTVDNFDIYAVRQKVDKFAIEFEGYIEIDMAGTYTFYTTSDDGSILYIDGTKVVDNDGLHTAQTRSGTYAFPSAGYYPIKVEYYDNYAYESLIVEYEPAGGSRVAIPDEVLFQSIGSSSAMMLTSALSLSAEPLVYPNPFTSGVTVELNGTSVSSVALYDLMNMQIEVFSVDPGAETAYLDLGHIQPGTYVLVVGTSQIRIIRQ